MSLDKLIPIAPATSLPILPNSSNRPEIIIHNPAPASTVNNLHSSSSLPPNLNLEFIQKLPELKLNPPKAFINEPLFTRIEIPEILELKNPQLMILSPILGPIDIKRSGLVEVRYSATLNPKIGESKVEKVCGLDDLSSGNKFIQEHGTGVKAVTEIEVRSLKPIPANIKIQGVSVPTICNFPIIITDQCKPVSKSSIEISARKLRSEEQNFMQEIENSFANGSFETTYPVGSAQPSIKIKYNQAPKLGKLQAGLKELWKVFTIGKGTSPLEGLFNTENKSPEQRRQEQDTSTDYLNIEILDDTGKMKSRFNAWGDYLGMPNRWGAGIVVRAWDDGYDSGSIGGRMGPIFNSASEFATYILNNFAFADQEKFAPQFAAQKPNPSMSKERELKPSKKVTGVAMTLAA